MLQVTQNSNFDSLTDEKCIDEISLRSVNPVGPSNEFAPTQAITVIEDQTFAPRNYPYVRDDYIDSSNTTMSEASFLSSIDDLPAKYWAFAGTACFVCLAIGLVVGWWVRGTRTRSRLQEKVERIKV